MKATVYHGKNDVRVDTVPDPTITAPTDAIVRIVNAAICGSDLWFYRGISQVWQPGDRTGHEWIGVIEEVGSAVKSFKKGDFVAAPFSFSDGTCTYCVEKLYTSCVHAGFWGGNDNDGGQGEYVRAPFADGTLVAIPDAVAHDPRKRTAALALTDVMGTGHHGCVRANVVAGGTVVVIGDGAVGLCAVLSAARTGAETIIAVGHYPGRLAIAKQFGATHLVDSKEDGAAETIVELTKGGSHSVVEAVGSQATLDFAVQVARPGGFVSFVGVPVGVETFDARKLFSANVSIGGALAPTRAYLPEYMADVAAGTIDPSPVFDLRLDLAHAPDGYKAMDARSSIKVVLDVSAL